MCPAIEMNRPNQAEKTSCLIKQKKRMGQTKIIQACTEGLYQMIFHALHNSTLPLIFLVIFVQQIYCTFCRSCRRRADTCSSSSFLSRCFNASVCAQILLWNAMRISISSCSRCRRSLASATCVVSSLTYSQPSQNAKTHALTTYTYSFSVQLV